MKCDYCGQFIKLCQQNSNQQKECLHDLEQFLEQYSQNKQKALQLSYLVQSQIDNVKQIDNKFKLKLDSITSQIELIQKEQIDNLKLKKNFLDNFDSVFDRLKYIKIQDDLQQYFKTNIQDYFEKNQVQQWVEYCQREIVRIENALNNFKNEFFQIKQQKLELFKQQKFENFDQVEILLMTFNILNDKGTNEEEKMKSFVLQLKAQHKNLLEFLQQKYENKNVFLKQLKKLFQRHRTIQKDILSEFSQNYRVLETFENFEVNFSACIEEIKTRNRFKYFYSKFLEILNQMTQKENKRRIEFIKEISNKIPDQIFPFLKELVKQLNITKVNYSLDFTLPKLDQQNEHSQSTKIFEEQMESIFFNQ